MNFVSGGLGLLAAWGIKVGLVGPGRPLPLGPSDWWLYTGGILGVVFIAVTAVLVRHLGVLLTGLGMIGGQLLGSLALDVFAPVPGTAVALPTVLGTLATLAAMVLATLPWDRRHVEGR